MDLLQMFPLMPCKISTAVNICLLSADLATVGHGQQPGLVVLQAEVLVREGRAGVDGHAACPVTWGMAGYRDRQADGRTDGQTTIFVRPLLARELSLPLTKSPPWIMKSLITRWNWEPGQH